MRPMREPIRWTAVPPSAAFRPSGVTPKGGNNVATLFAQKTAAIVRRTGQTNHSAQPARIARRESRIAFGNPTAFKERVN